MTSRKSYSEPTTLEIQTRAIATRFGLSRNRAQLLAEHVYGEVRK